MEFRRFEKSDLPAIRDAWQRSGYGFDFPEMGKMLSSWVAVENGKVIGWAGAQLMPEVTMIIDPAWGSPHWRLGLVRSLHAPLAQDVAAGGYQKVFANIDPKCPKFLKRLVSMGWWKAWPTVWRKVCA